MDLLDSYLIEYSLSLLQTPTSPYTDKKYMNVLDTYILEQVAHLYQSLKGLLWTFYIATVFD